MRTKEVTLYTFDELSDTAKDRARAWYRESSGGPEDFEYVIEDAVRMLEILGVSVRTHEVSLMNGKTRRDPSIWWQLGYSQSDGACFEGTYSYAKGAHRTIRQEAPQDTELHGIADGLLAIQKRYQYGIVATITARDLWPEVQIDQRADISSADYTALRELMRDLCQWIYQQLRTEDEYRSADAQVDDNIRANEYEFDEYGNRED